MFSNELLYLAPERGLLDFTSGNFARQVLVCALAEPDFPQNKTFLTKVLAAAGLDLEKDTLFAEIPGTEPFALLQAVRQKQAAQVLCFGIPSRHAGISAEVSAYRPFEFGGATWLFAEALSIIENDRERKGKLWSALKGFPEFGSPPVATRQIWARKSPGVFARPKIPRFARCQPFIQTFISNKMQDENAKPQWRADLQTEAQTLHQNSLLAPAVRRRKIGIWLLRQVLTGVLVYFLWDRPWINYFLAVWAVLAVLSLASVLFFNQILDWRMRKFQRQMDKVSNDGPS